MSFLYAYKPLKDRMLCPLSRALVAAGLTPNVITALGLLICTAAGIAALYGHLYAGIALFVFGACFDALDGSVARVSGKCSEFGRYFDSISDRLSELLFVAGAVLGGAPSEALMVVAGSFMLLGSRIYNHKKGFDSNAALFGRPERLMLLMTGLVLPHSVNSLLFAAAFMLCIVSSVHALGISGHHESGTAKY